MTIIIPESTSFDVKKQITESLALLTNTLGADLLGVYWYGSFAIGGLQKYSDTDLFVVTSRPTSAQERIKLTSHLLKISGVYMKSTKHSIDMTLVEKNAINPWHYPPTFDFQYGEWLRESFETGDFAPWPHKIMPDLALIITQVLLKSQVLFGPKPEKLLCPVAYNDFVHAMLSDVERLVTDLDHDTRNVLLTYARIWSTLETHEIRSKHDAADWALERLPQEYKLPLQRAKAIYIGLEDERWNDIMPLVASCAQCTRDTINTLKTKALCTTEPKEITLA